MSLKTFAIELRRTAHRFATVNIKASTLAQAQELALGGAGDIDFPGEKESEYFLVDGRSASDRKRLLKASASAFMSGDTPYDEYERLLEASEQGHGQERAIEYASVWAPLEEFEVDEVIGMIEKHADTIEALVL